MDMWTNKPIIFEDENEDELISQFVEFCARYPNRDPIEIAVYVFRNLKDPDLRSRQAAMIWIKDLDIQERIRLAIVNGGSEPLNDEDEKSKLQKELLVLARDPEISAKDRAKFYELAMTSKQMLPKQVEKTTSKKANIPAITVARYAD